MDIKQTANHLKRQGQPFDVILVTQDGRTLEYTNLQPTAVEDYLNELVEEQDPVSLTIQERKKNGSSTKKLDKYDVTLNGLTPNSQPQTPLNMQTQQFPSDYKDYLIRDLEKKNEKLEKRVEKLETDNDDLKKKNFELEKDNSFKDKEFELSRKEAEFDKSNGLAGVMEQVGSNPILANLAATAIGRLMGVDVPPMGAIEGGADQPTQSNQETTQEQIAGYVKNWLVQQDEAIATKFFKLCNAIAQDTDHIETFLNILEEEDNE